MEKLFLITAICAKITRYSIYAIVFLMPVLFLPWTSDVLDFNKQAVLIFLSFIAILSWMISVLILGKFEIKKNKIHIVVGALFLIYAVSTFFSVFGAVSFWGKDQLASQSMVTLITLAIIYFLVSNFFSRKDIFTSLILLFFSALIAQLLGVLQIFGLFVVAFPFAQSVSFNTIGSVGSLGIFTAILMPLSMALLIISKKWWKILFALQLVLSAVIIFAINYPAVWWTVILGSGAIVIFGILKRNIFDSRWMALPMFFLVISLFFAFVNPQIAWLQKGTNEVALSHLASFQIAMHSLGGNPLFGSGPGTFSYDFLKFKNPDISKSQFWQVVFNQATSRALTDLATTGILGLFAMLALMIFSIFYGIKFIISKTEEPGLEKNSAVAYWILSLGLLSFVAAQSLAYFLYSSNIVLDFIYFFIIASLVNFSTKDKKEYKLKQSSSLALSVTFIFTLVFIFGFGLVILEGQRYAAETNYYSGLVSWQAGNKNNAVKSLESAAKLNSSSDLYFRQLSQAYILLLQDELQNAKGVSSDAEKNKVQTLIANSINAAKIATDLNSKNAADWSDRGYIYQSLYGLVGDSTKWAISSYDQALKLDPNNPYLFYQEGNVNFVLASYSGQNNAGLLTTAKDKLEKAVSLNPNYSNALYSLGLVYDALGQTSKAIQEFKLVQQLNPSDTTVSKILSNLNAGLPALQSPPPATPPENNFPKK